jgi:hypothetical protein
MRRFLELFFEKRKQTKKEALFLIIILAYLIISRFFKGLDTLWFSIVVGITLCILGALIYLDRKRTENSHNRIKLAVSCQLSGAFIQEKGVSLVPLPFSME